MNIEVITHTVWLDTEKEFITNKVEENLTGKLDAYLKKFDTPTAVGRIETNFKKNSDNTFDWKLHASLDGELFHFAREKYNKLEDLVNHLFDHLKIDLSKK